MTTDDKPQTETEPTAGTMASYGKLLKLALPFLVALVPGGAAYTKSMGAEEESAQARDKGVKAWKLSVPAINALIEREKEARAERLTLTKELALLRGALSAKGIVPTSRAEVAGGPKPVLLEEGKKDAPPKDKPKPDKGKKPKPAPKPKKPPIKKLPTTLVA